MYTFNKSFNAEQSGAHPKEVQVTQLAIFGFRFLGSIGIYKPEGVTTTLFIRQDKNTPKVITQPKLTLQVLNLSSGMP